MDIMGPHGLATIAVAKVIRLAFWVAGTLWLPVGLRISDPHFYPIPGMPRRRPRGYMRGAEA